MYGCASLGKLKVRSASDVQSWPNSQFEFSVDRGEEGLANIQIFTKYSIRSKEVSIAIRKKHGPFVVKVDTPTI